MTSLTPTFDALQPLISQALDTKPDLNAYEQARLHQNDLLKPQGALGQLEEIALWLASWQQNPRPLLEKRHALVFAGNHGVIKNHPHLSAFPLDVTAQMVENFNRKKAAVNQISKLYNITLDVHALNLDTPTQDFTKAEALSPSLFIDTLLKGANAVPSSPHILCLGEMGIGNTTTAAALAYALHADNTLLPPSLWCGKGTGISKTQQKQKELIIQKAFAFHKKNILSTPLKQRPLAILQRLGGFEFAALTGAILQARIHRIPTLVDGYAASLPLAILHAIHPSLISHVTVSHLSQEQGHAHLLSSLNLSPLLNLNLRLGEASGAALAVTLCDAALACHNHMGSFSETLTSQKHNSPSPS